MNDNKDNMATLGNILNDILQRNSEHECAKYDMETKMLN